jgi:hypothetical protein
LAKHRFHGYVRCSHECLQIPRTNSAFSFEAAKFLSEFDDVSQSVEFNGDLDWVDFLLHDGDSSVEEFEDDWIDSFWLQFFGAATAFMFMGALQGSRAADLV